MLLYVCLCRGDPARTGCRPAAPPLQTGQAGGGDCSRVALATHCEGTHRRKGGQDQCARGGGPSWGVGRRCCHCPWAHHGAEVGCWGHPGQTNMHAGDQKGYNQHMCGSCRGLLSACLPRHVVWAVYVGCGRARPCFVWMPWAMRIKIPLREFLGERYQYTSPNLKPTGVLSPSCLLQHGAMCSQPCRTTAAAPPCERMMTQIPLQESSVTDKHIHVQFLMLAGCWAVTAADPAILSCHPPTSAAHTIMPHAVLPPTFLLLPCCYLSVQV
jgi:hypothetical protein